MSQKIFIPIMGGCLAIVVVQLMSFLMLSNIGFSEYPFEDAAMLFRYAEIFANGGGLSYNHGEHPSISDGATDLGFVLMLAPLIAMGFDSIVAAFAINQVGLFGVGFIISHVIFNSKNLQTIEKILVSGLSIPILMIGPVYNYVAAGFSPPFFGFLLLLCTYLGYLIRIKNIESFGYLFSIGALVGICGVWRPEGFFFGPLLIVAGYLTASYALSGSFDIDKIFKYFIIVFSGYIIVVSIYLIFRYYYFGSIFATSAVNKASTLLFNFDTVISSAFFYFVSVIFFILLAFIGLLYRLPKLFPFAIIFFISSSVWAGLSLTLNWWMRVQWPIVPSLGFILLAIFVCTDRKFWLGYTNESKNKFILVYIICSFLISSFVILSRDLRRSGQRYFEAPYQTKFFIALRKVDTANLKLATTEAGLIPLAFSGRVLDLYGHNHKGIARNHQSLNMILTDFSPDIVIVHGPSPKSLPQIGCSTPSFSPDWVAMTDLTYAYAERNDLSLFRVDMTGDCDAWVIYLKDSVSQEIRDILRDVPPVGRMFLY